MLRRPLSDSPKSGRSEKSHTNRPSLLDLDISILQHFSIMSLQSINSLVLSIVDYHLTRRENVFQSPVCESIQTAFHEVQKHVLKVTVYLLINLPRLSGYKGLGSLRLTRQILKVRPALLCLLLSCS